MLIVLLIIAALYFLGLLLLANAIWRAPEGFEDEHGFREGRPELKETDAVHRLKR